MHRPDPPIDTSPATRRRFLLLGAAAALAAVGCETSKQTASGIPDPVWPGRSPAPAPAPKRMPPARPMPTPPAGRGPMPGVLPRSAWAKGNPVPSLMNRMKPIGSITIHHDGMTPFLAVDSSTSRARIELIRVGHRNRPSPWGDIGYHFIVDRGGVIYEGRPIAYQGAHVKNHNEGNVGILCLGNFEAQSPSDAQLRALAAHIQTLHRVYRVPNTKVLTHREWSGAKTLCPGRSLQYRVDTMRANRELA